MARVYLLAFVLLLAGGVFAQPGNDECATAIALPAQPQYCSGAMAFSNRGATATFAIDAYPVCIDDTDQMRDVWFSFTALRNSVAVRVVGDEPGRSRGTLTALQYAVYEGDCASPEDIGCRQPLDRRGLPANSGSLVINDLVIGNQYYLMVGASSGQEGTFEVCVEQFDAPPDPSSDCSTAVILCDTTSFSVDLLQGRGSVADDLLSSNILCGEAPAETNSSWYKWTCDQAGTLSFDITPLGAAPDEDIDFVLYELTNGLEDCNSRVPVRQMFSGSNSDNVESSRPCWGSTGLRDRDTDTSEDCGCSPGDDSYAASLNMEAGKSYALVIINYSGSGDGFTIDFGGSGTFLGPEPNLTFSSAEVCVGQTLTFEDRSTSVDGIDSWAWDFGPTASPRYATGAGPHDVRFLQPGVPYVALTITTTRNCIEYASVNEVNVICCADQFAGSADLLPVSCPGAADGAIDVAASSQITADALTYAWSNGATTAGITGLDPGDYSVTVADGTGCDAVFTYVVPGPADFVLDTLISRPTCDGGMDGALQFTVLSGGAGDYEYSFNGGPFTASDRLENLAISTINVVARDANGCTVEAELFVDELQLELVSGTTAFTEPTCFGDTDGRVRIDIANGTPGYRYDFGSGYQAQPEMGGFGAGTYRVTAIDAERCTGDFEVIIPEPPPLLAPLRWDSSSCFGAADGFVAVTPAGGRPDYGFSWSTGSSADSIGGLRPGAYSVTVTDANGCEEFTAVTLTDPAELIGTVDSLIDLVCFNDPAGAVRLRANGGSPGYRYSSDGVNFDNDPLQDSLFAGTQSLYVMDSEGCLDTVTATLTEPEEFIITVEDFVQLYLGDDTTLTARGNYSPVDFVWGPDSVACLTPDCARVRIRPVGSYDYFVTGVNPAGCVDTAVVAFSVIQDLPTFIPNVFSPNGDGNNDFFTVFGGGAIERVEQLRVYDRWGGLLYEAPEPFPANEPSLGWNGMLNGRPVNNGVYVYYIEVRYINGAVEAYRGDLTVVQ